MSNRIDARRIRFIRLGEGSSSADECLRSDTLRIGFWLNELLDLCTKAKWQELARALEKRGKSKSIATNFVTQVRALWEDNRTTLWVTFRAGRMYGAPGEDGRRGGARLVGTRQSALKSAVVPQ